jgi:hypothetical protein
MEKELQKYLDKTLSLKDRKIEFKSIIDKQMNPVKNFNPDTFEPFAPPEIQEISDRTRKLPQKELPTFGIKPKEIREGQMIGMYESKQDLYLIFAHRCNDLQKQIDDLTIEINKLKEK